MIFTLALAGLVLAAAAPGLSAPDEPVPVEFAQLMIRERVIVHVQRPAVTPPARLRFKEKKAPRCMATDQIAGAAVNADNSVDFVLKGGTRLRARFESDCPALDYYNGFYLAPTADRKICADRDSVHARSGGECGITRFRSLVPQQAGK